MQNSAKRRTFMLYLSSIPGISIPRSRYRIQKPIAWVGSPRAWILVSFRQGLAGALFVLL